MATTMMNVKAAATMVGAALGLGTLVFGGPLWAALLAASGGALATKVAIDKA